MKMLRLLTFFSFAGLLTLSACSKKSDDVTPSQTQDAAAGFRVKIDGKMYAPDFDYALAKSPGNDYYYGIYGLDSKTGDVVVLSLPYSIGEGTSPINKVNVGMLSFNNNNEEFSTVYGGEGTVTITKKTTTNVVGTFSFTAYDATGGVKRTLTEGSFNVAVRY